MARKRKVDKLRIYDRNRGEELNLVSFFLKKVNKFLKRFKILRTNTNQDDRLLNKN